MRLGKILLVLSCALIGAMMFAAPALAQEKKPNVVFILVDNIGWGAFGVYGGTIPTPRIDKMASEGIRFNNYNVEAQCTPSRSAIMTGRHPVRSGTFKVPFPGEGESGLAPWEYTTAELLSDAGYTTRDSYMFFGTDGELLSIKWKIYKTIFRYTETPALEKPYIQPQFPMFYDLTSDPHEDNNLFNSDLTCGWILAPDFKLIGEYKRSLKEYPNIKVGEDFKGYKK